jgi:hypothetical protein
MQFLTSLFGGSGDTVLSAVLALGIVLVLIVFSVWLLKFVFRASENVGGGRGRRLMLIEALQVDQKRQLLILRRDDVEHVVLTGGPQDIVVETGIAVDTTRRHAPVPLPVQATQPPANDTPPFFAEEPPGHEEEAPPAQPPFDDRPRELPRALPPRGTSLRHTGLMRTSGRMEVIPGYLDKALRDSAKTNPFLEDEGGEAEQERDFKAGGTS